LRRVIYNNKTILSIGRIGQNYLSASFQLAGLERNICQLSSRGVKNKRNIRDSEGKRSKNRTVRSLYERNHQGTTKEPPGNHLGTTREPSVKH